MKKLLSLVLVAVLVVSLVACGGSGATKISMATGGTSGTYYGFAGIIAQVLNENLKDSLNITIESTGASQANIQLVDTGNCNMAIVQNDFMYYAYTATDMFAGSDPIESFSAVISCYPEVVQIVSTTDITSIEDLKGKNVSVGDAGSGCEFNAKQILEAYGITFDDITVSNLSFADSADALKNGTIDAAFVVAGTPTTAVTELATTYDFNLLAVDDEHVAALQDKYGFYAAVNIPAGTYGCVDTDVQAVAVMATIIASNDLSEDVVYNFLKGMFDYQDSIAASHTKGVEYSLEKALDGVSIPLHPGAEKYYTENGISVG